MTYGSWMIFQTTFIGVMDTIPMKNKELPPVPSLSFWVSYKPKPFLGEGGTRKYLFLVYILYSKKGQDYERYIYDHQ